MIRGVKPNGYAVSCDSDGKKCEHETRQCVHCQFSWAYGEPHFPEELDELLGHPTRRGWCVQCGGFLCGRKQCFLQQQKLIQHMRDRFNQTRSCVPYEEWSERLFARLQKQFPLDPGLTVTESGLIVPSR